MHNIIILNIKDSVKAQGPLINAIAVFANDTHIFVPSSRYYVDMKGTHFQKEFAVPVSSIEVTWLIKKESKIDFQLSG